MCGIVGYIGKEQAFPVLVKGLHRLEYRGYDSAGVALLNPQGILNVYKQKGKVSELETFVEEKDVRGTIGIAHTRWATHGEPTSRNAHPHCSEQDELALVHNGIIENYESLRQTLLQAGYRFRSDTDTEVLVQWIHYVRHRDNLSLFDAVRTALQQVTGSYAIAVIEKNQPDRLVAARKGSPLVVGIGEDALYVASDAMPIAEYTSQIVYPDNEEVVLLERDRKPVVCRLDGTEMPLVVRTLTLSAGQLEKGGYAHYMLKEIFEQPDTLRAALESAEKDADAPVAALAAAKRVIITACGTSWHAGLVAKYILERYARIPCEAEYASEFRYREPVIDKGDVLVAVSQSGETADTSAAIELARQQGAYVLSVCNVQGASIPRLSDACCYTNVGPEIGVASTKAFTAQVLVLTVLALRVAYERGLLADAEYGRLQEEIHRLPVLADRVLQQSERIAEFARTFTFAADALFLGRGYDFPIALEGALKLKEISYIHAEGYPAAEMKHGPIALVSEHLPVVVAATRSSVYEKTVSNIREVTARQGRVIAVVTEGDVQVRELAEFAMEVPPVSECLSPILAVIPLQLLAYYVALSKGCDVDRPRNLAKSVTVE